MAHVERPPEDNQKSVAPRPCLVCEKPTTYPTQYCSTDCLLVGWAAEPVGEPEPADQRKWPTGAVRDDNKGKGRYDLMSPIALRRDALLLEYGFRKYGPRNWEKGIPCSSYIDSAIRHLVQYMNGDRSEDHLARARWNIGCLMHTEEAVAAGDLPRALLDLPHHKKERRSDIPRKGE